jgi:hypothetical protein
MSMHDRLSLIGGAAYLNVFAAMTIGGFSEPSEIYKAIRQGEIKVNEKLLVAGDPGHERSWIQIEKNSYLQWLERRSHIDIERLLGSLCRIRAWLRAHGHRLRRIEGLNRAGDERGRNRALESAELRAGQARIERHLASLQGDLAELKLLLIDNLRAKKSSRKVKGITVGRRKAV